jgi:hypothetical protein
MGAQVPCEVKNNATEWVKSDGKKGNACIRQYKRVEIVMTGVVPKVAPGPVPLQMWAWVSPASVLLWAGGELRPDADVIRGEPSPAADVGMGEPSLGAAMGRGRDKTRRRCDQG